MDGIKIVKSDENQTEFSINDNITVTISAESFNQTGEMEVDYDENVLTEEEATVIVNEYFTKLLQFLNEMKTEEQGEA